MGVSRAAALTALTAMLPGTAWAALAAGSSPDVTATVPALLALTVFIIAYVFVISEEITHLRKSIPVVLAAGVVWVLVAVVSQQQGTPAPAAALRHNLLEYGELLLFLLAAMIYVNTP